MPSSTTIRPRNGSRSAVNRRARAERSNLSSTSGTMASALPRSITRPSFVSSGGCTGARSTVGARVRVSPLCAKSSSGMGGESGSTHSLARGQPSVSRWEHAVTERTQTMFSILLVEDSDEDYMAFTRALRDTVVTVSLPRCTRGEEALDYLHGRGRFADPAHAPRPALVLLDLNLPGMDGRELLTMIKSDEHLKSIPVVIVTTSRNPRDVEWCYQHGANSYQVKAVGYDQFKSAMRLLVEYWLTVCVLPATADRERPHA